MLNSYLLSNLKRLIRGVLNSFSYNTEKEHAVLNALATIIDEPIDVLCTDSLDITEFQLQAASLNEKTNKRKVKGVFYTDDDVVQYIIGNAFLNFIQNDISNVFPLDDCVKLILAANGNSTNALLKASVFDPTCGTGQFLLAALMIKVSILGEKGELNDALILKLLATIHGNDIDKLSTEIAMVRLFLFVVPLLSDLKSFNKAATTLVSNFTTVDYVRSAMSEKSYNIIIGNPPYIEYGKLDERPPILLSNTYANVVFNSLGQLTSNGVMAYIIPLSFVSTPRMKRLRKEVKDLSKKMMVINFADRPDCLFVQVHQKLSILLAVKGRKKCKTYSSNYYYWYKSERINLFDECKVHPSKYEIDSYIPKIGNKIEESIFDKIIKSKEEAELLKLQVSKNNDKNVYLNMRGTFWMKAFDKNPGSNEYKAYCFSKEFQPYVICILNSSLFFFFWIVVSDCWHITGKELGNIKVRTDIDLTPFKELARKLLDKLEKTKKYIGTVQCDYEYKHKYCKEEINAIDDTLAEVYGLTQCELDYIKAYQLKYRMSDGEE